MLVTVSICTLNHAESLRRLLTSLADMQVPADIDWEVVVVNNGATDHTAEIIASFANRLPLRTAIEPQRGLSRARNRVVELARGDYMLWTDDDVVVSPGWLAAYVEAFRRWPEAAAFGGAIVPRFEPPVPKWILENPFPLRHAFCRWELGDETFPLWDAKDVRYWPGGPSFALRTAEQRKFRFNEHLGLAPGQTRRGEEYDVLRRVWKSGAAGYWVTNATVEHCIRNDMQSLAFIRSYYQCSGETDSFMSLVDLNTPLVLGAPRWAWRQFVEDWLKFQLHRWFSPSRIWVEHLTRYSYARGIIRYCTGDAGRGKSGPDCPGIDRVEPA